MTAPDLERRLQKHSDLTKIGKDTRSLLREAALALSTARDEGPGTPMWRLNKLAEWTEKELGHNSTSSRGFEQTIVECVAEMKAEIYSARLANHPSETSSTHPLKPVCPPSLTDMGEEP